VPFPNTMVDRITPVTTPADIDTLADQYGISDGWPVVAEDFMQWVIEENFVDGCRPPFEKVGALVVDDVTASELMKIRLLNGGHSAISYISYLLGHRDVDKSMADPRIANFLRAYFAEVVTTVPPVVGVDLEQYQFSLITRFSNVHICDQVQRLAEDGSMKLFNTMRGPIMERLEAGKSVDMLALAVAGYSRYMMGVDEGGSPITIKDPMAATVHSVVWKLYCANASSKRFVEVVFGHELAEKVEFVSALDQCITMIKTGDLATTLETMLDQVTDNVIESVPPALTLNADALEALGNEEDPIGRLHVEDPAAFGRQLSGGSATSNKYHPNDSMTSLPEDDAEL